MFSDDKELASQSCFGLFLRLQGAACEKHSSSSTPLKLHNCVDRDGDPGLRSGTLVLQRTGLTPRQDAPGNSTSSATTGANINSAETDGPSDISAALGTAIYRLRMTGPDGLRILQPVYCRPDVALVPYSLAAYGSYSLEVLMLYSSYDLGQPNASRALAAPWAGYLTLTLTPLQEVAPGARQGDGHDSSTSSSSSNDAAQTQGLRDHISADSNNTSSSALPHSAASLHQHWSADPPSLHTLLAPTHQPTSFHQHLPTPPNPASLPLCPSSGPRPGRWAFPSWPPATPELELLLRSCVWGHPLHDCGRPERRVLHKGWPMAHGSVPGLFADRHMRHHHQHHSSSRHYHQRQSSRNLLAEWPWRPGLPGLPGLGDGHRVENSGSSAVGSSREAVHGGGGWTSGSSSSFSSRRGLRGAEADGDKQAQEQQQGQQQQGDAKSVAAAAVAAPAHSPAALLYWQPDGCRLRTMLHPAVPLQLPGALSHNQQQQQQQQQQEQDGGASDVGGTTGPGASDGGGVEMHPATCLPPGRRHVCFVGDSHTRYLTNSLLLWESGYTRQLNNSAKELLGSPYGTASYFTLLWGHDWPTAANQPTYGTGAANGSSVGAGGGTAGTVGMGGKGDGAGGGDEEDPLKPLYGCTDVLVNFGQWPASYRAGKAPYSLAWYVRQLVAVRRQLAALRAARGVRVWWLATVMSSLKARLEAAGIDWRTDPLLLSYNRLAVEVMGGGAAAAGLLANLEGEAAAGGPGSSEGASSQSVHVHTHTHTRMHGRRLRGQGQGQQEHKGLAPQGAGAAGSGAGAGTGAAGAATGAGADAPIPVIDLWSPSRVLPEATRDGVHFANTGLVGGALINTLLHALCDPEVLAQL